MASQCLSCEYRSDNAEEFHDHVVTSHPENVPALTVAATVAEAAAEVLPGVVSPRAVVPVEHVLSALKCIETVVEQVAHLTELVKHVIHLHHNPPPMVVPITPLTQEIERAGAPPEPPATSQNAE